MQVLRRAKSRMTLPNRCNVIACERRPICSSNSEAAGEIKLAKSASDATDFFQIPTGRVVEVGTQVTV